MHSVRFAELERLLLAYGFRFERAARDSHLYYSRGHERLSVPFRRPHVLAAYVREALRLTEGEDDA